MTYDRCGTDFRIIAARFLAVDRTKRAQIVLDCTGSGVDEIRYLLVIIIVVVSN
jgi:hypothetical protein